MRMDPLTPGAFVAGVLECAYGPLTPGPSGGGGECAGMVVMEWCGVRQVGRGRRGGGGHGGVEGVGSAEGGAGAGLCAPGAGAAAAVGCAARVGEAEDAAGSMGLEG